MSTIPLRIHHPAAADTVALVQTFGWNHPTEGPSNLLREVLLPPGETVTASIGPGGAVVITEAPSHVRD